MGLETVSAMIRDKSMIAPFVIVESPFAGNIPKNLRYVRACMRDCILRGEAPFASHALYTQEGVLRDEVPEEREIGMNLGWHVMTRADRSIFYTDLGWSSGMVRGWNAADDSNKRVETRRLGNEWSQFNPGVDYARGGSAVGEAVPPNSVMFQIIDTETGKLFDEPVTEIDLKQGWAVVYEGGRNGHIKIVKFNPGRYVLKHRD